MKIRTRSFSIATAIFSLFLLGISQPTPAQDAAERVSAELSPRVEKQERKVRTAIAEPSAAIPLPEVATSGSYVFSTDTSGSFTNLAGSTQLVASTQDDTASPVTSIPFDFYFMGVRYNQFSASSNGYIRLGGTAVSTTQYTLGTAGFPLIASMGSDLFTSTTGRVHYLVTGTAPNRVLTVEFLNMTAIYDGAGATADCTSQVRLYETSGVIEFVYGNMTRNSSTGFMGGNDPQYIGFSTGNAANTSYSVNTANVATVGGTPTANQFPLAMAMASLNSPVDGSRRRYLFTPPVPTAPTALNFTAITPFAMTLNWTDSPNEDVYAIYRSTDGVNYTFQATAAENATSIVATGLSPSTNYFWQVFAVSEGALSAPPITGTQATAATPNHTCNGAGGLWSAAGSWVGGVPTATENVTIGSGCTVTIDIAASALNVTVQSGGVLQFEQTTARTLTVGANVTIDSGGTLRSNAAGTVTTHVLSIGGDLVNNGTLDLSTNGNTAGAGLTFTGAANNIFGGAGGTTDIRTLTINKGTSSANILELNPTNFTVQGTVADGTPMAFLTLTNGTLKVSGTFTVTGRVFTVAGYTIPATGGFWLNNPNFSVVGQNGSPTVSGLFRITQGTFNIGTSTGNSLGFSVGSTVIVEGGAVNVTGRFGVAAAGNSLNYTQTAGTVTVCTIGNGSATLGSFDLGTSVTSAISISGGTIVIQLAATAIDYRNQAGNGIFDITGGTLQLGNASSGAAKAFNLRGVLPNLVITNTSANHTATMSTTVTNYNNISLNLTINAGTTFNAGNVAFLFDGTSLLNNGTLTHNGANSNFVVFNAAVPVSYSGTGTVTAPMSNLALQSDQGFTISPASPNIVVGAIRLFSGSVINSNKITLGSGGASSGTVQIGNTTTPTAAGAFDVPFTFNMGTGGQILSYLRTTASRSTGPEVNPGRSVTNFTFDDNDTTHALTLSGGDLTVGSVTTLANGRVITGANTFVSGTAGTVTRTTGYIDGNFRKDYSAIGSKTFEVGTAGGYSPAIVNVTAGSIPFSFTVTAKAGLMAGAEHTQSLTRYWTLTPTGITSADITLNYLDTDVPVTASEAAFQFVRHSGPMITSFAPSSSNTTTNTFTLNGVTAFSDWTLGQAASPTAAGVSIGGRVLTASGQAISGALVRITDLSGRSRSNMTGPFGYFNFDDVVVGQDYVITAGSKSFVFAPRFVSATQSLSNVDLIAAP